MSGDFFRRLWRERRPVAIGLIVVLLLAASFGGWALASSGGDGRRGGRIAEPGPVPGGGQGPGGQTTTTPGANAAPSGGGAGGVPDESPFEQVLALGLDTSGLPGAVNTYWSQNFETLFSGYRYEPPSKIKPYRDGEPPDTACTAGKDPRRYVNNALHCRADHSLAYSVDMLRKLYDELGDFAPVVIMFHEFGHHVDMLSGEKSLYTIQGEWEADCLAGIATRGAMQAGVLHEDDVREGSAALYGQGSRGGKWWSRDDHGTPEQREAAFMTGYHGTVEDCERIGNQPPGLAVQAPPYEILVVNGSTGGRLQNGVYRLNTPGTTVKTDIKGYAAQLIPARGDAPAQYDDVWASWFEGSQVTGRGPLEAIPVEGPQGRVDLPVNKLITVDGSYQAYHYDQILDGRPVHGVMLLHVWQEENSSTPSGAIIIDVYDEGDSSVGWGTVYQQLLDVLLALHPKQ